jgi:hypothetical protein
LYCPQPLLVTIAGSTWGGSMIKVRFIGRGMHLEFRHPGYLTPIVTSIIREIRECQRTAADRPGRQIRAERFAGDECESRFSRPMGARDSRTSDVGDDPVNV